MTVSSSAKTNSDEAIAKLLLRDEPALVSSLDFGPFVRQGTGSGPALLIGDSSEISLLSLANASRLDYRMALLARPGDHVIVRHRSRDFETYLGTHLGLADVTFHQIDPDIPIPVTKQAWATHKYVDRFAQIADTSGGLTLKSYLTTGHTWRLAQAIGEHSGHIVHVSGPSPRVSRRANDKLWFANLAKRILGTNATPPTLSAYGPAATAGLVRRISQVADQVIVKIPDSAGSAGNLQLDSTLLKHMPLTDLRRLLLDRLHALGWQDSYPVLVGVWDKDAVSSPSAQLWLPSRAEGMPILQGIFEQRIEPGATTFVGASRSTLPDDIQEQIGAQAARIADVLQQLGYYGRCSFDAVLCRSQNTPSVIHWIECNARWGGVSIPMTAVRQLAVVPSMPAISVVQEHLPNQYMRTNDLLERTQGLLVKAGEMETGLIVMSPPEQPNAALINLLAVAETQATADDLVKAAMNRLTATGLS